MASPTARDLIRGSLRLIGAIATGETPSADEFQDALSALNAMTDSWSNEGLTIFSKTREAFTLVSGQGSYTFGPSGNFNSARPLRIEQISLVTPGPTDIETPIEQINGTQYDSLPAKDLSTEYPMKFFNQDQSPLTTITFYPVPLTAKTINVTSWKALPRLATANATLDLPPGYERAIRYNLAIELCPEYGKSAPPEVAAIASESKANIKSMNSKPVYMISDAPMASRGSSSPYKIFSGS